MNQEITRVAAPVRHFTVLLSATPRGARLARRLTLQQLTEWSEPCGKAEQVVAELAANAALHARLPGRSFRLTLALDRGPSPMLRIAVSDPRPERLPVASPVPAADAESGRGLLIVAALADRWGVDVTLSPLKTVWAELDLGAR